MHVTDKTFSSREREREREKERGVPVMDFTPLYTREPLTTHSYTKKHILKGRSLLYFFFFDQKKQKTKKVHSSQKYSRRLLRRPKTHKKKTSRIIENHGRPISTGRRSDDATSSDEFAHGCQQRQRRRPVRAGPDPHRDARVDVDRGTERR